MNTEKGFTILEVLVAINLSFLALTFTVSFFLFTYRLTSSIQRKIEINNDVNNILFRLEEKLNRADDFVFELTENELLLVIDNKDSVWVTDSLVNFSNIFYLEAFENFETSITTDEEVITHLITNSENTERVLVNDEIITSEIITSVNFGITAMNKKFLSTFYRSRYSAAGFRNIR